MALEADVAPRTLNPLALIASAVPLGVLLGAGLLPALLHPFSLGQLRRGELPPDIRRAVVFLAVTALLPLGGLAIPAWLWLKDRRWTGYERRWLGEGSGS